MGKTINVSGDQDKRVYKAVKDNPRSDSLNNLFLKEGIWPEHLTVKDPHAFYGDADFHNPGGSEPEDYIPQNRDLVKNMGVRIPFITGDRKGLEIGLTVKYDFFGTPVTGYPDMGAIELRD